MGNCHSCGEPLTAPYMRCEFVGAPGSKYTGSIFMVHAACLRLVIPDRRIELAQRLAEPNLCSVAPAEEGWRADCREHGGVAIKDEQDDAELACARHLARMHAA